MIRHTPSLPLKGMRLAMTNQKPYLIAPSLQGNLFQYNLHHTLFLLGRSEKKLK